MSIPEAQLQRETLIGRGLTAEVFSWGQDCVLKLCLPWRPLTDVQREYAATQAIHAAGLPAPAAFALVAIGDRHGIIFERIRGPSLVRQVESRPWTLLPPLVNWQSCMPPSRLACSRRFALAASEDRGLP